MERTVLGSFSAALPFDRCTASDIDAWPVPSLGAQLVHPRRTSSSGNTPALFSLTHPVDELRPVSRGVGTDELVTSDDGIVCGCCTLSGRPAVVFHNPRTSSHSAVFLRSVGAERSGPDTLSTIIPEISLVSPDDPAYREPASSAAVSASRVFAVDGPNGESLLCLLKDGVLDIVSFGGDKGVLAATVKCISAVPLRSALGTKQITLLAMCSGDGTVTVNLGCTPISTMNIAKGSTRLKSLRQQHEDPQEQQLHQATAEYEDGTVQNYYFHVLPRDEVVATCADAMVRSLDASLFGEVLRSFNSRKSGEGEWDAFESAVLRSVCTVAAATNPCAAPKTAPPTAWDALLASDLHRRSSADPSLSSVRVAVAQKSTPQHPGALRWDRGNAGKLVEVLHSVYEDSKLSVLRRPSMGRFASLLHALSSSLSWPVHGDHYARDFPELLAMWPLELPLCNVAEPQPFSVHLWLLEAMSSECGAVPPLPTLRHLPERTRAVCRVYRALFSHTGGTRTTDEHARDAVLCMAEEGITTAVLATFSFGVALPMLEACVVARRDPSVGWPAAAFDLIGRPDLAEQARYDTAANGEDVTGIIFQAKLTPPPSPPKPPPVELGVENRRLLQLQQRAAAAAGLAVPQAPPTAGSATASTPAEAQQQVFDGTECDDDPIVSMLFPSDKRVAEVRHLLQWSRRESIPVEVTEGTEWDAEQQEILKRLAQRTLSLPVGRGALTLSIDRVAVSESSSTRFPALCLDGTNLSGNDVPLEAKPAGAALAWPSFHNGVAAALRIAPGRRVNGAWMTYNNGGGGGVGGNDSYAGFLLGLGLQGHLRRLPAVKSIGILASRDNLTTVATLLGLAAGNAGTMSESVTKTLCVHIPFLRPVSSPHSGNGAGISRSTIVAADGVGVSDEVVASALVGIGIVFRGTGHRRMVEVLLEELATQPSYRAMNNRESYALAAGLGLGLVSLGCGDSMAGVEDLRLIDTLSRLANGGPESEARTAARKVEAASAAQSQRPSLFLTNGWIDTSVTAPGAILGLGMMFMGTGSSAAARVLRVPETRAELECVRPDHLLLRALMSSLIMRDSIEASAEWVESCVPEYIRKGDDDDDMLAAARGAICAGAVLAIGMKYAGTKNPRAKATILSYLALFSASTGVAVTVGKRIVRATRETFVDNSAIAASLVMAGSGDVDVLRALRSLRLKAGLEVNYGHHMARHMAIGFLFLGGGILTFSNSKEAVASLLCSLFPLWPVSPGDNTYHLQALRHLYVMAVECRLVVACDVDLRRQCFVPMVVTSADGTSESCTSPFALPDISSVESVKVMSPRYWPVAAVGSSIPLKRTGQSTQAYPFVVFVRRKAGYLPYADDPMGVRSIAAEVLPVQYWSASAMSSRGVVPGNSADVLRSFSSDPQLIAFAKHMCSDSGSGGSQPSSSASFNLNSLLECVTEEKVDLLPVLLALWRHALCPQGRDGRRIDIDAVRNVALVVHSRSALLPRPLIHAVDAALSDFLLRDGDTRDALAQYFRTGSCAARGAACISGRLHGAIAFLGVPPLDVLANAMVARGNVSSLLTCLSRVNGSAAALITDALLRLK